METSFLELRCKEVVNIVDGRNLGHITDIVFDLNTSRVTGVVVPGQQNFWNLFKSGNELFIPFCQICKVGEDSILVEIFPPANCPQNNVVTYMQKRNTEPTNE